MAVTLRQLLVSASKYGMKCPYQMVPDTITVHNTANDASAENEINYMIGNSNQVSFHIAVDDKEAVQGIPLDRNAWHAGDGNGAGNRESIAIEICYSKSGGERFMRAERNAAELIAQMLKQRGWGLDRVKKHQDWSGKNCPHRTIELGWQRFLNMINEFLGGNTTVQPVTPPAFNTGGSYQGNSIVDYLNSIGKDSSMANRKKLAAQYGIANYSGTSEQNLQLLNKMRDGASVSKPSSPSGYTGSSIVDYLNSIGKPSDFNSRASYARQYGIANYSGTSEQNTRLLNAMRGSGSNTSTSSASFYGAFNSGSIVDGLKSIGVDESFSNRKKIAEANGISNYSGTASQNNKLCELARNGKLKKA